MDKLYRSLDHVNLSDSWLTIGVFDGVHRGHQEIIQKLTAGAHSSSAPAVVLTFDPHPALVLAGRNLRCLTTPHERAEILTSLGVDFVICLEFTHQLAEHSAEDFMRDIKQHIGVTHLLAGYDFALGKNRAGNLEMLRLLGQELEYQVTALQPVKFNDTVISSTLIRQLIAEGNVRLAAEKLGRYYAMTGPVVPGDARGRTIGIPTANIEFPAAKAVPANGVYACWAVLGKDKIPAVVNIGLRPTFNSPNAGDLPRVEAHLLDFAADLYGQPLTLEFVDRLRDEQKFPSIDALISQIHTDIQSARTILSS